MGVRDRGSIIFSSKHMKDEWHLGFNPFVTWAGEEDDLEQNTGGEDKVFPLGPECTFMGKKVPCYTCCSENGSITGQLLTDMLSAIDKAKVFDRSVGLNPFLLLDGHNSRFELEFLQYIHEGTLTRAHEQGSRTRTKGQYLNHEQLLDQIKNKARVM